MVESPNTGVAVEEESPSEVADQLDEAEAIEDIISELLVATPEDILADAEIPWELLATGDEDMAVTTELIDETPWEVLRIVEEDAAVEVTLYPAIA